jgi:hypothetical protein
MSRGMRFVLPELRERMRAGLEEIRSGQFAREWAAEQEAGCPTVAMLKRAARELPSYQLERELWRALGLGTPVGEPVDVTPPSRRAPPATTATQAQPAPGPRPRPAPPGATAGPAPAGL